MPNELDANYGAYLPTTNIWDVSDIYNIEGLSDEMRELLVRLYQNIADISTMINIKESAYYPLDVEFLTGQLYFPDPSIVTPAQSAATTPTFRPTFRTTVNFGALPNTATKSVPHHILFNSGFTVTSIYGAASDPVNLLYKPLPYPSTVLNNTIQVNVDATNVNITTAANYSAYTRSQIIIEYMKF